MFKTRDDLPPMVTGILPDAAQALFLGELTKSTHADADHAWAAAWAAVKDEYQPDPDGGKVWVSKAGVSFRVPITKTDEERQMVFGWAYMAKSTDGSQLEDWSGKIIEIDDLEPAAYEFMVDARNVGEMHETIVAKDGGPLAYVIESVVITKEKLRGWGLAEDAMPLGWWVGVKIRSPELWAKVKDGTYKMFSVGGSGYEVPIKSAA